MDYFGSLEEYERRERRQDCFRIILEVRDDGMAARLQSTRGLAGVEQKETPAQS